MFPQPKPRSWLCVSPASVDGAFFITMSHPNYYAIITAEVRYDKDLSASEKLFYAEITALTNMNGSCSASNAYFAELYGVARSTISLWVKNLMAKGYIKVEYDQTAMANTVRIITLKDHAKVVSKSEWVVRKPEGGGQKIRGGWSENQKQNNTPTESNNTPTESNTTGGVFERIQSASSFRELVPIWTEYIKSKGRFVNATELDVIAQSWAKKDLTDLKTQMVYSIENGWKSLVPPPASGKQKTATPFLDSLDDKPY